MGLSDGQMAPFDTYAALLEKWQRTVNLVGPKTVGQMWHRHFADSAQLALLWRQHRAVDPTTVLDIGSGAGFPGLVLALLTEAQLHSVEVDQRKAAFQRQVALATGANAVFHVERVEAMTPLAVDVVVSRACAPLTRLVPWAQRFATSSTEFWFLKGREADAELTELANSWTVDSVAFDSLTEPGAKIVRLSGVTRRTNET